MTGRRIVALWWAFGACSALPTSYAVAARKPATPQAATRTEAPNAGTVRRVVDTYCIGCHNARTKSGSLVLENLSTDRIPESAEEIWEKVIRKVRIGSMPPAGMPRPADAQRKEFVASLEQAIDAAAAHSPNPGRPALHRLNRTEFVNAVRDVLHVEIDGTLLLPADDTTYGFDNVADSLRLTPSLLERYLLAAKKISRMAVGDRGARPAETVYQASPMRVQEYRMSDDLPAGSRGGFVVTHDFPADGEYTLSIELQRNPTGGGVRGRSSHNIIDVRLDGARIKTFDMRPAAGNAYGVVDDLDKDLILRFPAKAGPHRLGVTFDMHAWVAEGTGPFAFPAAGSTFQAGQDTTTQSGKIEMGVHTLTIEGPDAVSALSQTPSRKRIFTCTPTPRRELTCARSILATLARRAYRRPVATQDVEALVRFYNDGFAEGGFDRGIEQAITAMLVNPAFLLRAESEPSGVVSGGVFRITDIDLASRLSFFLWSSVPDDELLNAAERGRLHEPAEVERQVRRMMTDARFKAFITNFFGQWLSLRALASIQPDPQAFPAFDDNLRDAFQQETLLFVGSQLRDDRPVPELLTANYTYMNERLARHYGVPYVYGSHFRRVPLPDHRRAGIMGHGSVLTTTSYANRTSPVVRGKWLLDNVLGTPPPPPPPNVPPFPEDKGGSAAMLSVREKMERHRKNPVCAACHASLNPMGFALENFDAVGTWRTTDAGKPIDTSGMFPGGARFDSVESFRASLTRYEEDFVTTLVEKLLTYGTGRGAEYSDMPAIRGIVRDAATHGYQWSSVLLAIVRSAPFQMRRSES